MLKRILVLLLAGTILLSSAGCTEKKQEEASVTDSSVTVSDETSVESTSAPTEEVYTPTVGGLPLLSLSVPPTAAADSGITLPDSLDSEYLNNIKKILDSKPYACALYYVDLETGLSVTYNPDRMFAGASLIKAEYLMMIFEMIESGEVSYDDLYTYTQANKRGGTTKIPTDFKFGDKLTLKQIIEYVVWHSDNTGYNMLQVYVRSYFDIINWAKERYGTTFKYKGCNWLNARGVAECWKEIYDRYKNGDENYKWYIDLLLEANENKFIRGGLPKGADGESIYKVAHKYGMDINASNDAAIVFYNDRPYFLCILTDYIGINTQSFMNEVSAEVLKMHEYICSFDK